MVYGVATFCIFHKTDSVFRDIEHNYPYADVAPIKTQTKLMAAPVNSM